MSPLSGMRVALSSIAIVALAIMPLTGQQPAAPASSVAEIPLAAFAVPFKDEPPNASVLVYVEIAPSYFMSSVQAGEQRRLGVALSVNDTTGLVLSEKRHVINTAFGTDSLANVRSQGFRLVTQIAAPAGVHELRISVVDNQGGSGSAFSSVDIPDFTDGPLRMSGVSLYAWPQRPQMLTVVADVPMAAVLPWAPTTAREFARAETVAAFVEVYETAPAAPRHQIEVTASVQSEDGRIVAQVQQGWSSDVLRGRRGEYGLQLQLPLASVSPGAYAIHVEARSENGARVERVIPIRVR